MPQRRILFLDAAHLIAYRAGGGKVHQEAQFTADAAGQEAFTDYLKLHRSSLFMLLADVADEGFQIEDIPHCSGKDRAALVKRKLGQYFYGTPLSVARSLGRMKTGRRDERLLLMALTQPQNVEPWLDILRQAHATLTGIYSVPQLVLALLPLDAPPQLLVITQAGNGLRQTFFVGRQLRFSRLLPLVTGTIQEAAIATSVESAKMHQYLMSQRLIDRDKPLATRILAHPAHLQAVRERCQDSAALHFEFADILQEGKRTGLHTIMSDSRADLLLCHLLAKQVPAEQFAPPEERRVYRLWQTRFALKTTAAVIFAGGLLFSAKQGITLYSLRSDTEQIQTQIRLDQQRYDTALQALPKIPLSTDNLRALVTRYDTLNLRAQGPVPLLVQLSRSLDAFPGVALEKIEWKTTEQIEAAPITGAVLQQPGAANLGSGPFAQVTVAARLPLAMVGNQRSQLTLVADFIRHLGATPSTAVAVLQPPVDTQSGMTLKSGDERSMPEAPKFTFRLIRKL